MIAIVLQSPQDKCKGNGQKSSKPLHLLRNIRAIKTITMDFFIKKNSEG